jgi:hypothetical protein
VEKVLIRVNAELTRQEICADLRNELISILGQDRDKRGRRQRKGAYGEAASRKELVATIRNPILLTDINAISRFEPTTRDTLVSLYQSYPRTVEYDEVSVRWDPARHVDVWGPSIDTLVFAKAMKNHKEVLGGTSALEIGSGSGFLGKYLLHKSRLLSLDQVDLNPYAVLCTNENVEPLHKNQHARAYVADGTRLKGRFDRVLCSPPYVPRPKSIEDNPYEGVGLLRHMIVGGGRYVSEDGMVILTTSSLCQNIRDAAIEDAETTGRLDSVEVIGRMNVPLKVNPVLNNVEWMSYLRNAGLAKNPSGGYEYWHEINILKLSYK